MKSELHQRIEKRLKRALGPVARSKVGEWHESENESYYTLRTSDQDIRIDFAGFHIAENGTQRDFPFNSIVNVAYSSGLSEVVMVKKENMLSRTEAINLTTATGDSIALKIPFPVYSALVGLIEQLSSLYTGEKYT